MKKFVIQWRKFELKRSYIFKVIDFLNILDFFQILFDLFPYLKLQKGVNFRRTCGADVARETRADVTWHARPRGRATRPRGELRWLEWMQTRGRGHTSSRGCPRGRHVASEG